MEMILSDLLQAVILTKNEESNIERVLKHLTWVARVVVIDSLSTDATERIVKLFPNTEFYSRPFDTHANQWNYGLQQANSQWILSLDADYVVPDAFAEEISQKLTETDFAAFDTQFRFLVFGKALRGNNTTPRPVLFQKELCTYYDDGHTQRLRINGKTGVFSQKIDHDDRKPLSRWLVNQSAYSVRECEMLTTTPNDKLSFTSKLRKKKILAPFFVFFYCLFIKGLILDGWRGWYYTMQRTIVEMLFALRLIEHDSFSDTSKGSEAKGDSISQLQSNKPSGALKILHIMPSYKPAYVYGGPIESVAKLCEGLIQTGKQEVHVYTTTANGDSELPVIPNEAVLVDGVPVTYFTRITKDHSHLSPQLWKHVYNTCRNYDVVHIHSWWNTIAIFSAIICHFRNVKVIVSPRGMLSDYIFHSSNSHLKKFVHAIIGRNALKKAHFHATAPIEYEECTRLIPGWTGFMVPNLITLPDIPIDKQANDVFTLMFLSRIHPKKGIEFLIDALPHLDNIVLKIAGSGDEEYIAELEQRIIRLGVGKKVVWAGWQGRTEKFTELMQADLFVLISYNENFANSVVEALHMGTPVLISDMVGLAPFVKEKRMGWITGLNSKEVTDKLKLIISEASERQRIQKESRGVVDKAFSEKQLIEQYIEHYRAYIAS